MGVYEDIIDKIPVNRRQPLIKAYWNSRLRYLSDNETAINTIANSNITLPGISSLLPILSIAKAKFSNSGKDVDKEVRNVLLKIFVGVSIRLITGLIIYIIVTKYNGGIIWETILCEAEGFPSIIDMSINDYNKWCDTLSQNSYINFNKPLPSLPQREESINELLSNLI
jgi:hypothetical protein